jgi:hypothetical protein
MPSNVTTSVPEYGNVEAHLPSYLQSEFMRQLQSFISFQTESNIQILRSHHFVFLHLHYVRNPF